MALYNVTSDHEMWASLFAAAEKVHLLALENKAMIALAESCTGGMVSMAMTAIPGSSQVLERSWCVYSYDAKVECLNVDRDLLYKEGAVSMVVAEQMAKEALSHSRSNIGLSITGIAGPDGGSLDKPVGLVYMAGLTKDRIISQKHIYNGDRQQIRLQAAISILQLCEKLLTGESNE